MYDVARRVTGSRDAIAQKPAKVFSGTFPVLQILQDFEYQPRRKASTNLGAPQFDEAVDAEFQSKLAPIADHAPPDDTQHWYSLSGWPIRPMLHALPLLMVAAWPARGVGV